MGALLAISAIVGTGCGMAPEGAATSPSSAQLATTNPSGLRDLAAIRQIRGQYGLREDLEWIETVQVDPSSVVRYGIKVSPQEAADLDERALANAIELRGELGFSTDREWVRLVLADPSSVSGPQDLVVSPGELRAWEAAQERELTVKGALSLYAREHHAEWAGSYQEGDRYVVMVKGNADAHRAALAVLIPRDLATLDVRQAEWSLGELNGLLNPIEGAIRTWVEERGMLLWSADVDIPSNRVAITLKLPKAKPGVEGELVDEFDGDGWMEVTARVDQGAELGRGRLDVQVVDGRGRPVPDVFCVLIPDIPGAAGDEVARVADEVGICRWQAPNIGATTYRVQVRNRREGRVLGTGRVRVPEGGGANLTIQIASS